VKWRTFEVQREPGFRLNLTDLITIALLLAVSSALYLIAMPLLLLALVPFLGLSFFLFCNVFRIGNKLEPWWYVPFAVVTVWGVGWQQLEAMWWIILTVLEPGKWLLISYQIRRGHYVGAGYRLLERDTP
jgi:hypothetical protein